VRGSWVWVRDYHGIKMVKILPCLVPMQGKGPGMCLWRHFSTVVIISAAPTWSCEPWTYLFRG